jgi:ABC-type phosphate/phosphonate transport system ATPase subunit
MPNLNPMTDEPAASLDPVTERLMALMREKGQR